MTIPNTYHRDGTVTYWSAYRQVWRRRVDPASIPGEERAAMSEAERRRLDGGHWYTTFMFGSGPYPMPPRGPWPSRDEADEALDRWRQRAGDLAGTIEAAHSVRLQGPYRTRAAARDA